MSERMKQTPGPWNASWNGTWIVKSVAGWLIAKIAPPTHYTPEQVEGHAHLIAAAPELLEALRLGWAFHSCPFASGSINEFRAAGYTGEVDAAEMRHWLANKQLAAIAKATGGTL